MANITQLYPPEAVSSVSMRVPSRISNKTGSLYSLGSTGSAGDEEVKKLINNDKNRLFDVMKLICVMALPLLALILITGLAVDDARRVNSEVQNSLQTLEISLDVVSLVANIQKERGISTIYISSNKNEAIRNQLISSFKKVNDDIKSIRSSQNNMDIGNMFTIDAGNSHLTLFNISDFIEEHRIYIFEGKVSVDKNLAFYSSLNKGFIDSMVTNIVLPIGDDVWKKYVSINALLPATDAIGVQRAIGSSFFASCFISQKQMLQLFQLEAELQSHLSIVQRYDEKQKEKLLNTLVMLQPIVQSLSIMRNEINNRSYDSTCEGMQQSERFVKSNQWFDATTSYINTLLEFLTKDVDTIINLLRQLRKGANQNLIIYLVIMVVVCVGGTGTSIGYSYSVNVMTGKISKFARKMSQHTRQVADEKKKSEKIIHQMLPKRVADDLKLGKHIEPEYFENVTVYFSDVVGFTKISSGCTPNQIVALLNTLYTAFDSTIEKYDAYKIETIGDAYVVASGLPQTNGLQHAKEIADMSIGICEAAADMPVPHDPSIKLKVRIGLHSGPVAAGVVGITMPRYCIFGDTVLIANKMESTGEALKIHISETTAEILDTLGGYIMTTNTVVDFRGKGQIKTFWLFGHTPVSHTVEKMKVRIQDN